MKQIWIILLVTAVLLTGCGTRNESGEPDDGKDPGNITDETGVPVEGSLLADSGDDFLAGTAENTKLNEDKDIVLEDGALEGKYTSPLLTPAVFRELVATWNADTPAGTEVELSVQVRIDGEWSPWLSYGKWASYGNQGSIASQSGNYADMAIDVVEIVMGREADAFKYSVALTRNSDSSESPKVRQITVSLRLWTETAPALDSAKNWQVELDVPERSQMVVPEIGNVICSPTALSMVLEYYGHDIETEVVAASVRDSRAGIYGNWAYNVAYAGSLGLTAYVDRFVSLDQIKDKIADGIPVVCSIRTDSQEALVGAPMAYPSGHLLVVRGFTVKDGEEYVIVNDPAAPGHDSVRREYKAAQFERAWRKIVYIVTD